jgi:GNAT superfamily N-acetyltransferase
MVKEKSNKFLLYRDFNEDPFLKNIFKKNCYVTTKEKNIKLFKYLKNTFILLKTKKKINKNNSIKKNLKFIGTNKTYYTNIESAEKYIKKKNISYKTRLKDKEKKIVINISFKNFKYSRFHLDKRLPTSKSNLIKKKTLENYFLGHRCDKIFVQFYKKNISGFCLLKFENRNLAIIDLICIDKKFSRKGLAGDLIKFCLYSLEKINKKKLIVGTQEENLAATKLYSTLKFIPISKVFLYHYIS